MAVVGQVGTSSVDEFVAWFERARRAGHHEMCLDAAEVRFTDGAGRRALVDEARRFRAAGRPVSELQ